MVPVKLLKKGIETLDWSLICKAYEGLTGDSVELPTTLDISAEETLASIRQLLNNSPSTKVTDDEPKAVAKTKKVKKKVEQLPKVNNDADEEDLDIEPQVTEVPLSLVNGKVKANKPVFPYSDHIDPELAKINKSRKIHKEGRKAYKAVMRTCACGTEFDINKEYPLRSKSKEDEMAVQGYKCNKCRIAK